VASAPTSSKRSAPTGITFADAAPLGVIATRPPIEIGVMASTTPGVSTHPATFVKLRYGLPT
jgi:hypothetical protein